MVEKASLLRQMPPNVAIATLRHCVALAKFRGNRRNSDALFATQCLSIAIETFGGIHRNSDALGHSVAITTSSSKCRNCYTFVSVGIVTLFYKRWYSDGFRRDGKNLGKFPTFGQKRQNQVSEFPLNVLVSYHFPLGTYLKL